MKRPSFQFYPADWQGNSNLRRCTHEEKGIWIDVLCLLHDQEEYGAARWTLKEIAGAVGVPVVKLKSLVTKRILKGADAGEICKPYIFIPTGAGRKKGDPVELVCEQPGPLWYSSRMVEDEYKRKVRADNNSSPDRAPIPPIGASLKVALNHAPISCARASHAGASSSSPSPSTTEIIGSGDNSQNSATGQGSQSAPPPNSENLTAGEVCKALKARGLSGVNPGHATLTLLLQAGAALDEFTGAADDAIQKGKTSFSYVLGIVKGRREEAKAAAGTIKTGALKQEKPWFISVAGVESKALECSPPITKKSCEYSWPEFQRRVFEAHGITDEMFRKAKIDHQEAA